MDSYDIAYQYDIDIAKAKIKTNEEFIEELKTIRTSVRNEDDSLITDPIINTLIKKHDYKIKEAEKELIHIKAERGI